MNVLFSFKNLLFTTLFFFFSLYSVLAQIDIVSSNVQTTVSEYEMLTTQMANKDDFILAKGYEFLPFLNVDVEGYGFKYRLLKHTDSNNIQAISIVCTKFKKNEDKVRYLCLPFNNMELFRKYQDDLFGLGVTMGALIEETNEVMLMRLLDEKLNGQ